MPRSSETKSCAETLLATAWRRRRVAGNDDDSTKSTSFNNESSAANSLGAVCSSAKATQINCLAAGSVSEHAARLLAAQTCADVSAAALVNSTSQHVVVLDCALALGPDTLTHAIDRHLHSAHRQCASNDASLTHDSLVALRTDALARVVVFRPATAVAALATLQAFVSQTQQATGTLPTTVMDGNLDDGFVAGLHLRSLLALRQQHGGRGCARFNPIAQMRATEHPSLLWPAIDDNTPSRMLASHTLNTLQPLLVVNDFDHTYHHELIELDRFETIGNDAYDPREFGLDPASLPQDYTGIEPHHDAASTGVDELEELYLRHLRNRNAQARTMFPVKRAFLRTIDDLCKNFNWSAAYIMSRRVHGVSDPFTQLGPHPAMSNDDIVRLKSIATEFATSFRTLRAFVDPEKYRLHDEKQHDDEPARKKQMIVGKKEKGLVSLTFQTSTSSTSSTSTSAHGNANRDAGSSNSDTTPLVPGGNNNNKRRTTQQRSFSLGNPDENRYVNHIRRTLFWESARVLMRLQLLKDNKQEMNDTESPELGYVQLERIPEYLDQLFQSNESGDLNSKRHIHDDSIDIEHDNIDSIDNSSSLNRKEWSPPFDETVFTVMT